MRRALIFALLLLLCLAGGYGAELEGVELIRVLGVDGGDRVTLTAAADGEDRAVYSVAGENMGAAREALKGVGTKRLGLTHVSALLLGETAEAEKTLRQELTNRKSGCGASVWLCEGSAQRVLEEGKETAERLRSLEENAGVEAPTMLSALRTLRRTGRTVLPVVQEEAGELTFIGYKTIWEEGKG